VAEVAVQEEATATMTPQGAWMLLGGIVILYLYDSALLLFHNELVLIARRGGWRVSGGSGLELAGRHVFLPLPFAPHQPLFRLSWPEQGVPAAQTSVARFRRVAKALSAVAPWTQLLMALFVLGLPCALFVARSYAALLACLVAIYSVIGMTLLQVYRHRRALQLDRRAMAFIASDALLCAPFALNIVRKISLRLHSDVDLRAEAATWPSAAQDDLRKLMHERIRITQGFLDPDSAAYRQLDVYLNHFEDSAP
jgi:hypothetical protein